MHIVSKKVSPEIPEHPFPDFDCQLEELSTLAKEAHASREKHNCLLIEEALRKIDRTEAEIDRVDEQLQQLQLKKSDFELLDKFGAEGLSRVDSMIAEMTRYKAHLQSVLATPRLRDAREQREARDRQVRLEVAGQLDASKSAPEVQDALTRLVHTIGRDDIAWALDFVAEFEARIRKQNSTPPLEPILKFWRQLRQRTADNELLEKIQEKIHVLREEIGDLQAASEAQEDLRKLTGEIEAGVRHLDQVGRREQIEWIHLWLGKLRSLQEKSDFKGQDSAALRRALGRINTARKEMKINHYFDALDRCFNTDWEAYVNLHRQQLNEAREDDQRAAEERRKQAEAHAAREQRDREGRAEAADRLEKVIRDLQMLDARANSDPMSLDAEEARCLMLVGVNSGGSSNPKFLEVAARLAALAYGGEFRCLRRSLRKMGVPEDQIGRHEPPPVDRFAERFEEFRPLLEGKRLLIVGGFPNMEITRRLEQGLNLEECRWYEHYHKDQQDDARAALFGGAFDGLVLLIRFAGHKINDLKDHAKANGVPLAVLDRGCGVSAIFRGIRHLCDSGKLAPGSTNSTDRSPL